MANVKKNTETQACRSKLKQMYEGYQFITSEDGTCELHGGRKEWQFFMKNRMVGS